MVDAFVDPAEVVKRLKKAAEEPKPKPPRKAEEVVCRRLPGESGITARKRGRRFHLEFDDTLSETSLRGAFGSFLKAQFGKR